MIRATAGAGAIPEGAPPAANRPGSSERGAASRGYESGRAEIHPSIAAHGAAEDEFIEAIEAYKISSGRMFPTWSEVLEVLRDLGYAKAETNEPAR